METSTSNSTAHSETTFLALIDLKDTAHYGLIHIRAVNSRSRTEGRAHSSPSPRTFCVASGGSALDATGEADLAGRTSAPCPHAHEAEVDLTMAGHDGAGAVGAGPARVVRALVDLPAVVSPQVALQIVALHAAIVR
ncbi:MAG: hypothetical protein LH654_02185 [Thermoleophilia bacterium]|nr:hypothetical protein [Thermoleophilia bacterium]